METLSKVGQTRPEKSYPKKKETSFIIKTILRILLGAFFVTTAILKLLSLDNFEIYIYSFHIFDFVLSTVVARLVIAAELLLGILLIAKIKYRLVWWLTMAMLIGFTLLLIYTAIFRHDANCHCMGDLVQLDPISSIAKNVVSMILMLFIRKEKDYRFRGKAVVGILAILISIGVPFAAFPMDVLYNHFASEQTGINEPELRKFMQDSTITPLHIDEGKHILGFLAASCRYCEISGSKLNMIMENNGLDTSRVLFFIWGQETAIQNYRETTGTDKYRFVKVSPFEILNIIYGKFPTFVLLENGKVVNVLDLRHLDEKTVTQFLQD